MFRLKMSLRPGVVALGWRAVRSLRARHTISTFPGVVALFVCLLCVLIAPCRGNTVPGYVLRCTLVPEQRHLAVSGDITLAGEGVSRDTLHFQLSAQMHDLEMRVVAPRSVVGPVTLTPLTTRQSTTIWAAKLPGTLPAHQAITLHVSYQGGEKTAFVFHIGPDGCYGGGGNTAWYPQFGPLVSDSAGPNVATNGNGIGTLAFVVPEGLVVLASGKRMASQVAAKQQTVTFAVRQPVAFAFTANHYFVQRREGRIPVTLYRLRDGTEAKPFLEGIAHVLAELERIYGPYPYPEFALAEVSDASTAGAGFGGVGFGGFMLSTTSFLDEGFNLAFFGHEIGHQWWGNLITIAGNKGAYLLEEGLAQYGSLDCVEHIAGPLAAARYRRDGYPGYILTQCGSGFLNLHAAGYDHILEDAGTDGQLAHELADNKGFLVWSMLADVIGAESLHTALREIARHYAFGEVTYAAFLAEFERQYGKSLHWFWEQWLRRTGAPRLDLSWTQSGTTLKLTLRQSEPTYRLRLPVRLQYADGSAEVRLISVEKAINASVLPVAKQIVTVELDPDFRVLHYTSQSLARAEAMKEMTEARFLMQSGHGLAARAASGRADAVARQPDPYGVEFEAHLFRAGNAIRTAKDPALARRELEAALRCAVRPPARLVQAYRLLVQIAPRLQDIEMGHWAAQSVLLLEQSLGQETAASYEARDYLKANAK